MTNHHCVRDCAVEVSPPDTDYTIAGFIARKPSEEKKCEGMYVDQLESIENVTSRVNSGVTATDPAQQATQRAGIIQQIQTECNQRTSLTCQVVTLYAGGIYSLYTYKRYDDLRLVFSPEDQIGAFGGDPDNFTYPRYNLDAGLLRVYVNGKPHTPKNYLRFSKAGAKEDELVFVVGNPGSTGRLNTLAQMEYLRDVSYPANLAIYQRTIDVVNDIKRKSPALAKPYEGMVLDLENARKAVTGYRSGLVDSAYMAIKEDFEREFRARLAANPQFQSEYGGVYDAIANAQRELATFAPQARYHGFGPVLPIGGSRLLNLAGQIVRVTEQSKAAVLGEQPIDSLFERLALTAYLRSAQAELPVDDPFLQAALGGRTPEQAAAALVSGTRIGDPATRKSLVEGGQAAIAASNDPMIVLARQIDPLNRAVQARAGALNATIAGNAALLGRALFATYGTQLPPDATFTLRISDGLVKGYPMNGTIAPYKTSYMGLYARSVEFDAKFPFDLPPRWVKGKDKLDLTTPFNFVTTNDIIGGSSGSPMINRAGEVVGLVFDGNIENVANRFLFQTEKARTVAVHSSAIIEALRKMYAAPGIADELQR